MIVVEDEYLFVVWIRLPADPRIARAKIAVGDVVGKHDLVRRDLLTAPCALQGP